MAMTINHRKMVHLKSPDYLNPNPAGNTVAGGNFRTFIPFFDGLNLSHGTSIQALCNPIESVNEKYHMINFGNEVAESGGSGGESSYVF